MELIVLDHNNIIKAVNLRFISRPQLKISVYPDRQLLQVKNVVVVNMVHQKDKPSLLVLEQLYFKEFRLTCFCKSWEILDVFCDYLRFTVVLRLS